jgi:hypothetical protein
MVEDKTLKVDIWNAIRSALVGKVYITNTATTTTTVASIVATFNDEYPSKPIVEVMPLRVEETLDEFSNIQGNKDILVTINCYYKNSLGVDQMDDQITDILKTTKINGISLRSIYSGIPLIPNDNKYHIKSLSISYNRK